MGLGRADATMLVQEGVKVLSHVNIELGKKLTNLERMLPVNPMSVVPKNALQFLRLKKNLVA